MGRWGKIKIPKREICGRLAPRGFLFEDPEKGKIGTDRGTGEEAWVNIMKLPVLVVKTILCLPFKKGNSAYFLLEQGIKGLLLLQTSVELQAWNFVYEM